jgi:hypothetical protein
VRARLAGGNLLCTAAVCGPARERESLDKIIRLCVVRNENDRMCESEKLKRTVKPNRCVSVFFFFFFFFFC